MASYIISTCPHEEERHIYIRCGCPNRRGPEDPMYLADDAYHRKWCKDCKQHCYQDVDCAFPLPHIAADVSSRSDSVSTHAIACVCGHKVRRHCTIRCGCPNLRDLDSPMHLADDAFHRHWCSDCLRYCSQDDGCTSMLPSTQALPPQPHSISFNLHLTIYSVASGVLLSMKAWIRRRMVKWRGETVKW